MSELIINKKEEQVEVCVLENNSVCEIYVYDNKHENITGNIYCGKVRNVVDGMQAAFVDIGIERNAFISLKDAAPKVDIAKGEVIAESKISNILKPNDEIIVQVTKAPTLTKGARVSTHITLPGNYIVLMPNVEIVTVSQKIDNEEKSRLLKIVKAILPSNFGAIVRTEANGMCENVLKSEIDYLKKQWKKIEDDFKNKNEVGILYNEHELISKIGRELINSKLEKIYVNDENIFEALKQYIKEKKENITIPVENRRVDDIIKEFGFLSQVDEARERKIWLKNGGYIVIDKTEALTAIDVNSGKYLGNSNLEQTALAVNSEAAKEIMKQLRLRDLGGIIIIDYIDLKDKEHQRKIIEIMEEEALKDRSKIDIKGYTELNLVELTRKMKNI